jgi:MFS family permease
MADHVASELVGVAPRDGDVAHVEGAGVATNSDSSTSTDAQSEDNSNPRFHAKTFLILVTCALLYFTQLGFIISTGAFGRSIASVIGGADKVSWLVDSTAITVVVLSVPINVAADYWGRRWFIIVLTALGFTGCFVLASSKNITVAIVGAVLGSLGGCTVSLVHAIASEVLPRKYRMLGQALLNAGAALGGIFALMIGGLLTRSNPHGFRTFFYIFGGIYAASTVVVFLFYTPPPRPLQTTLTQREKLAKMDWIGSILLGIGGTLISVALSWAENPCTFNSQIWPVHNEC